MIKQLILCSAVVFMPVLRAADAPANPLAAGNKVIYGLVKKNILDAADQMSEENYSFKPVDSVRSFGEILAHIADDQYNFCSAAANDKTKHSSLKSATTKAAIQDGLKSSFNYCDQVYNNLTDAEASTMVPFFGKQFAKLAILNFNTAHDDEHYGNLVTYMRLKGLVPPSSKGN